MARFERDESASGSQVSLSVGDELTLRLGENPTTGYRWALHAADTRVLALVRSEFHLRHTASGGGGERWITFAALLAGSTNLVLKLWRAWEGESSVDRRFELTVIVS
jgi:inhibitor of cysteine peptidase